MMARLVQAESRDVHAAKVRKIPETTKCFGDFYSVLSKVRNINKVLVSRRNYIVTSTV